MLSTQQTAVISVVIGNGVKFKLQMQASVKMHTGLEPPTVRTGYQPRNPSRDQQDDIPSFLGSLGVAARLSQY